MIYKKRANAVCLAPECPDFLVNGFGYCMGCWTLLVAWLKVEMKVPA